MPQKNTLLQLDSYKPAELLDTICKIVQANNDVQLSKLLETAPSNISKIRNKVKPVSGDALLAMHEVSGLSIRELRKLMGDKRKFF